MNSLVFSLYADPVFTEKMIKNLQCKKGEIILHQFPDEENSITIKSDVKNKNIILLAHIEKPNFKIVTLIFFAELAKELGATSITLITPYLAYMRQDNRFNPGEGISSIYFARLLSKYFDSIITIDPHLHRYHKLDELFTIPGIVLHATKPIAQWIKAHVVHPLIIGPDNESKQWAQEIAQYSDAPFVILSKTRQDDHSVSVTLPELDQYKDFTPVLVDDIISTGKTMMEAVKELQLLSMKRAVCIAVHGVFAGDAYQELLATHVSKVVTCNTIKHISNEIDIYDLIIEHLLKVFSLEK